MVVLGCARLPRVAPVSLAQDARPHVEADAAPNQLVQRRALRRRGRRGVPRPGEFRRDRGQHVELRLLRQFFRPWNIAFPHSALCDFLQYVARRGGWTTVPSAMPF